MPPRRGPGELLGWSVTHPVAGVCVVAVAGEVGVLTAALLARGSVSNSPPCRRTWSWTCSGSGSWAAPG